MYTRRLTAHFNTRFLVSALVAYVSALQLFDFHSTLSAPLSRHETNKAINWLSEQIGFAAAVTIGKLFCLVCIAGIYFSWRMTDGTRDAHYLVVLTIAAATYTFVVLSNYVG